MEAQFAKQLAITIHQYRKKSGLTQQELADLAGVGKTAIFDIEHSKPTVQFNTILRVMNVLNIKFEIIGPLESSKK
jgi:y4mF family transcriptional regulator